MSIGVSRSLFVMAASVVWLAGCETASQLPNPFKSMDSPLASVVDAEPTGSVRRFSVRRPTSRIWSVAIPTMI